MSKTTELLQNHFEELQKKYEEILPKVDPKLINDLLLRQMENPGSDPMYIVETFLEPGTDIQKVRETILQETGMVPAIYDNGTHVAAHHPLTLEILERISNKEGVIEVTGDYDTGNWAASREHRRREPARSKTPPPPPPSTVSPFSSSQSPAAAETKEPMKKNGIQELRKEHRKSKYLVAAYTAAGIIGAIALAGFINSGGMLPNSNSGIQSPFHRTYRRNGTRYAIRLCGRAQRTPSYWLYSYSRRSGNRSNYKRIRVLNWPVFH